MAWSDVVNQIVGALGGTVVVLGALAAWLGKVWSERIAALEKKDHEADLKRLQSVLDSERSRLESVLKAAHEQDLARLQSVLNANNTFLESTLRAAHEQELARLQSVLDVDKARVEATLGRVTEAHKQLLQSSVEIDLDLRKRRLDVYPEIWKITEKLPRWPRAEGVSYQDLRELSASLREWYFNKGGMFLSRDTHHRAYSPLQDAIADLWKQGKTGVLTEDDYEDIRNKCSTLRTFLASDILSRRQAPFEPEGETAPNSR